MDYISTASFTEGSHAFALDREGKIIVHPSMEKGTLVSQAIPGFWESLKEAE